jgi:D-beta-D-heptose 7-phosphate kinase/D-beta-D-heptose 1-phosphate adenosyltransferase
MNPNKIFIKKDLINHIQKIRKNDLILGFTNGCFDLLHKGHLALLSESRKKCDYLIVGVNSDTSVKTLKGKNRPIDKELVRLNKLANLKDVDALIMFSDETPIKLIKELLPDIIFKGADYKNKKVVGSDFIIQNGGKIEFIDILDGISTTNIIKSNNFST